MLLYWSMAFDASIEFVFISLIHRNVFGVILLPFQLLFIVISVFAMYFFNLEILENEAVQSEVSYFLTRGTNQLAITKSIFYLVWKISLWIWSFFKAIHLFFWQILIYIYFIHFKKVKLLSKSWSFSL